MSRGEHDQALACFRTLLDAEPDNSECAYEIGKIYKATAQYDRSIALFEAVLAAGFERGGIYKELGEAYYIRGRHPEALETFTAALRQDPDDLWITARLGILYQKQGASEKAGEMLVRAQQGGLDLAEIHACMGEIRLADRDLAGAEAEFERYLAERPGDRDVAGRLLQIYRECGKRDKEKELARALGDAETAEEPAATAGPVPGTHATGDDGLFLRNKALNHDEIARRETVLRSRPLKLGVALTEACNLRCRMCSVKNDKRQEIPGHTVREIAALLPYLEYVQWLGGEAFLSRHFADLFDRAAACPHLKQSVNTNGLLITEEWAERLVRNAVKLDLSIDGISPGTYESIRQGGKFATLVERLESIRYYREKYAADKAHDTIVVAMNFVVMKTNCHEIEGIVEFARRFKIDIVQLSSLNEVTPEDVARQESIGNDPVIAANFARVMPQLYEQAAKSGIRLYNRVLGMEDGAAPAAAAGACRAVPAGSADLFCREPWQSMFIMPGPFGMVRPDCLCIKDTGNVTTDSLETIWNGPAMQEYRKRILEKTFPVICNRLCVTGKKPENFIGKTE